jgi:hypothetical protein
MIRAFQWDLARQTERFSWLLEQLPKYADWGYQELYLHLEDAVEFPRVPGVARADAYSYRQMERLVAAAGRAGLGVVPIVNLLGHTQYLIKVPELRELNELAGPDGRPLERGQICPLHPRTLEVADRLIADAAPWCTAGKLHVGLDESYHLGQHPLCRAEVAEAGLAGHFGRYVQRLHRLVQPRGLRMGLWADMLALLPEAIRFLPGGTIAYDWYYYPFRRHPAVELHNYRPYDLTPALRRQGVEYWGCPMSGPFRFEPLPTFGDRLANLRSWWDRCKRVKAAGFLVTAWEPSRVAAPVVQAVDAAAAQLWLPPKGVGTANADSGRARSDQAMLAGGMRRAWNVPAPLARSLASTALAADRYPYAGYFRWELDEDWAFGAGRGDAARLRKERRFFDRLIGRLAATMPFDRWARRAGGARPLADPERNRRARALRASAGANPYIANLALSRSPGVKVFAASLVLRAYLAARDEYVVTGRFDREAKAVFGRRFPGALRAAWLMWSCTRLKTAGAPGGRAPPHVLNLIKDRQRWSATSPRPRTGPSGGRAGPTASFCLHIRNFRPALQKVIVQQQDAAGAWHDIRGRFVIEFTVAGARPRALRLTRPLAVPVAGGGRFRVAVRGVGQVEVSGGPLGPKRVRLGKPAPIRGFPALDWQANLGAIIEFEVNPNISENQPNLDRSRRAKGP